ncbi:MAG: hypothetical protein ACOCQY_02935 [Halorhabdus sp.]
MGLTSLGPSISEAEREQALEQRREEHRQQQDEQTARSLATGAATQQGTAAPGYWDMLGDPDLDHPEWGDSLEPFVQAELSRAFALGNISRKDWRDMQLRIENEFWQIQNEMRGPNTSISDGDMRLLYGEERPDLDDDKARRLRGSREVKKMLTSLSVGSRGLRSGTEIHAVARTEDANEEEAEGLFAGLGNYLGR